MKSQVLVLCQNELLEPLRGNIVHERFWEAYDIYNNHLSFALWPYFGIVWLKCFLARNWLSSVQWEKRGEKKSHYYLFGRRPCLKQQLKILLWLTKPSCFFSSSCPISGGVSFIQVWWTHRWFYPGEFDRGVSVQQHLVWSYPLSDKLMFRCLSRFWGGFNSWVKKGVGIFQWDRQTC